MLQDRLVLEELRHRDRRVAKLQGAEQGFGCVYILYVRLGKRRHQRSTCEDQGRQSKAVWVGTRRA